MFDASDSAADSVDRSRRHPMRRYIIDTPVLPTKADRPRPRWKGSSARHIYRRHDDGAARGDYSTAVFCILPARLSCSACSVALLYSYCTVLKTVPHWNPLFATRVFHPGIFGIHKIPVYIRVLLHSRVGLTTMSCTRVFCLILAETHEYYS